ncbi:MAG TPA: hypothetical protein VGO50_11670 [Pyrinomonadaceae bacterium]|jgi:hypothetical protein|nr:hypothetical protein [Pyrinomonadaceae bacterium]
MMTRSRLDITTIAMVLIASIFLLTLLSFVASRTVEAQKNYTITIKDCTDGDGGSTSGAETPPDGETPPTAATEPTATPEERLPMSVTDAYLSGSKDLPGDAPARSTIAIGDTIDFQVENLQQLVNDSQCVNSMGVALPGCDPKAIRLFLDGVMLPGITADSLEPTTGTVKFHLERIRDGGERAPNAEQWKKLISTPLVMRDFFKRQIEASVGLENGVQMPGKPVFLVRVQQWLFWVWLGILVALAVGLIVLAKKTDILRDQGAPPPEPGKRKPYSLAKCQAAFWFFLTITAFCFIFIIVNSFDSLTEGVLGLLGISAGTAVGSAVIDKSSQTSTRKKLEETQTAQEEVASEVSQLEVEHAVLNMAPVGEGPEKAAAPIARDPIVAARAAGVERQYDVKKMRMDALQQRQEELTDAVMPRASQGFRNDILTDEQGSIGFHRLQLVLWTLVLGGIFVYTVWRSLAMPDFNTLLVTLQGISGATYLGFKIPENQA